MKYWVSYIILFLLLSRCSFSEKGKIRQLEEKVLHEHDVAMSHMERVNSLQRKLQTYLQKADTTQIHGKQLRKQIHNLKRADAAMMDWMHQYRSPDTMSAHAARIYLQDQLQKIKMVKQQMDTALTRANKTEQHYARTKNK